MSLHRFMARYRRVLSLSILSVLLVTTLHLLILTNQGGGGVNSKIQVGVVAFMFGSKSDRGIIHHHHHNHHQGRHDIQNAQVFINKHQEEQEIFNDQFEQDHMVSTATTTTANTKREGEPQKQQCNIPNLDPWHVDVLPYIDNSWRHKKCNIHQRGRVENGKLILALENVQRAGYYYVRRKDEDTNVLSEWHSLRDTQPNTLSKESVDVCLIASKLDLTVVAMLPNSMLFIRDRAENATKRVAMVARAGLRCSPMTKFVFKKNKSIAHLISERCMVPRPDQKHKPLILAEGKSACDGSNAKFELLLDGKLRHIDSGLCATINLTDENKEGFFNLQHCENGTRLHIHPETNTYKDLDVTVPLTEDIIRVDYVTNNKAVTEYFTYPLNNKNKDRRTTHQDDNIRKKTAQDPNKLNIMYIMVDSISRASAQRYLNTTYKMLENDPNSVILKGHTIVGDGTTAQVLSIFVGEQERDLPEARRGHNFSEPVDRWPWIWKDFEKMGYTTVYGEDDGEIGTFNYRLKGFKAQPTTKYLRPWYMEIDRMLRDSQDHSTDCAHKITFKYIKDLYKEFPTEKKFLFHASNLGHNNPTKSSSMDEDLTELFVHLNKTGALDNSLVVVFGDHGDRTASFRKTMQGKLEERLPFMSLTFPSWFHKKFPNEVRNLKRNSAVLTSHYDLHVTNKHLLTFPHLPSEKEKFGRSLFTDIASLNRACGEAGVEDTWCPCIEYKHVENNDKTVIRVALEVVVKFNQYLNENPTVAKHCQTLVLKEIIRARKVVTGKNVEHFVETFRNEKCDECGQTMNETVGFQKNTYELLFEVGPSGGQFELMVDYDLEKHQIVVKDDFTDKVSRVNRYGDQPNCVAKQYPYHRQFCYCKDFVKHL